MAGMYGADPDQLQNLGTTLKRQMEAINTQEFTAPLTTVDKRPADKKADDKKPDDKTKAKTKVGTPVDDPKKDPEKK